MSDLNGVYYKLSAREKYKLSCAAKELMDSEVVQFIFDDMDERVFRQIKNLNTDVEPLIKHIRSMNTLRTQIDHWAQQLKSNLELANNG